MAFTIAALVEAELEVKKSRFQGLAQPVQSESEVRAFLAQTHDQSASHQCWAWKIGHDVRFYDAGEPTGTAGRPILASIEGNALSNVLVVVNRWFGGIKLGTGGLVRAYASCAGQTLLLAEKIELIARQAVFLRCQFAEWAQLQYELQQYQVDYQQQYGVDGVEIHAELTQDQIAPFKLYLQNLTRGRETLHLVETEHD
jgi:uncharacterized YigZ family protein